MNLQAMQPQLSEFQRMAPENNPWLQQMQQFLPGAMQGMQQVPQQYQPSFMSQLLGGAGSIGAGLLGGGFGGGGGGMGGPSNFALGQMQPQGGPRGWTGAPPVRGWQ